MKKITIIISILSLAFVINCTQSSELPFPENNSILLKDEPVTLPLSFKQEVVIDYQIKIKFDGVGADSRCPIDVMCFWAGDGEVFLNISTGNSSQKYTLHTTLEPCEIVVNNYLIKLINLLPATRSDRQIKQEEYNIEIKITKLSENYQRSVQLINASQTGMINRDLLNITDVSLINDILNFTVGYSGGCKEHLIELFALKEIAKSNPARVSVNLSHFANGDMCEAYVTRKMQFDLKPLKQFLKNSHGINDGVILIISDPSGRPIRNPGVEYKF